MQTVTDSYITCVALVLAATAAFMSVQGHTGRTLQFTQWLSASFGPEAIAIAGAIGEHPEVFEAP
jgi:hypothetical protein